LLYFALPGESKIHKRVQFLYESQGIGENALIETNYKRVGAIIAMRDCHFGVLKKSDFHAVLAPDYFDTTKHLLNFLADLPCFQSQRKKVIQQFIMLIKMLKLTRR
jgi:hypothetical protein